MTKPVRFRIYPERRGLYYLVLVHASKRAMLAHCKREGLHHSRGTTAQCSSYDRVRVDAKGRTRMHPTCGEINFHRQRIDSEIVAHEALHAVLGWAGRRGIDLTAEGKSDAASMSRGGQGLASDDEERLCYAIGRMVAQLSNRLHEHGIW